MSFLNPGGARAGRSAAALTDEQARQSRELFGLGREEYEANRPLLRQLRGEASLDPAKIEAAGARATTDVERGFSRAKEEAANDLSAMGGSPADAGFQSGMLSSALGKSQARAFAGDAARRGERTYRTNLAQGLMQRPLGFMSTGTQGVGQAAQTQQNDPRQGLFGVPGLSLARGGKVVRAPMGGRLPYPGEEEAAPRGPGAGIMRDPNPPRDVPMMHGSDGTANDPAMRGPDMGGSLSGPGTETSDSIPAQLSHGEYINPAFVGEALGTPAQDAIVEVARRAQEGDPMARTDLMKLLRTVASFRSTNEGGVPQRTAGETPRMGAGMGGQGGPSAKSFVAARGGGTIVRRLGMARPPVRAAGGGLLDLVQRGAGLFQDRAAPARLQSDYAADSPTSEQPIFADREAAVAQGVEQARGAGQAAPGAPPPMPWYGRFEEVPYQGRGKTSLRNVAKLAASAVMAGMPAKHGGRVGAGIPARRA